jgi:hypothetical protein
VVQCGVTLSSPTTCEGQEGGFAASDAKPYTHPLLLGSKLAIYTAQELLKQPAEAKTCSSAGQASPSQAHLWSASPLLGCR